MKFKLILEMDTSKMPEGMTMQEAAQKAVQAFQGCFHDGTAPVKAVIIEGAEGFIKNRRWSSHPLAWVPIGSVGNYEINFDHEKINE